MADFAERAALALLFGFFAAGMYHAFIKTGAPSYLILAFSECLVLLLVLVRRQSSSISLRPGDWLVAFGGTTFPLLIVPGGAPVASSSLVLALMIGGLLTSFWSKLALCRSFGVVAANRGVKTGGPYAFVRHPMYAGYLLVQIGFLMSNPTLWNAGVYSVALLLQILRMRAEEHVLMQDPAYLEYVGKVRFRLLPGVL
jgi:protein-S-isoprenylcysteine O-methyltransferase Ste14